ncbi:hypothetical protein HYU14_05240 [Candidatus Woesearchaeota archaeon]|nr:hypothetical protein [Candidatus Woesearchaeota archaeon]
MGDAKENREQMQEYLARKLSETGEFSRIERKFSFAGDQVLGNKRSAHLFAELKPEFTSDQQPQKYLIVVHSDESYTEHEIMAKLRRASELGMYTVHILYRYPNSGREGDSGPLFRRFVLDKDRAEGEVAYRHRAAFNMESLKEYPKQRRDNFRRLRELERDWIPRISGNTILFYQPPSARLKEMLKRYEWGTVILKGIGKFGRYREEPSLMIKEPILIEDISDFTLSPLFRASAGEKKVGEVVSLAPLPTGNLSEQSIRRNLGKLHQALLFGLGDKASTLEERLCIQLEISENGSPFLAHYEALSALRNGQGQPEKELGDDGKAAVVTKFEVPSRSQQGKSYFIAERKDYKTGNTAYACSCPGFHFRKTCGHIEELLESLSQPKD